MGDDWAGKFDEFEDICEVVYLPRTPAISTTALIEKISDRLIVHPREFRPGTATTLAPLAGFAVVAAAGADRGARSLRSRNPPNWPDQTAADWPFC